MNTTLQTRIQINEGLRRLIYEYQAATIDALILLQRAEIRMPTSATDWADMDIPLTGSLDKNVTYDKHGHGCDVCLSGKVVNFDFGRDGEVGLFDAWKLFVFTAKQLKDYGLETYDELEEMLEELGSEGLLKQSSDRQYLVVGDDVRYAIEVDGRRPGDLLPLKSVDPVITLYLHQFLSADLMKKNYEKIIRKWKKDGRISDSKKVEARIYLSVWLGFLRGICEGFDKLSMRKLIIEDRPVEFAELVAQCDVIGRLKKRHGEALQRFRNNTFHSEVDYQVRRDFFDREKERVKWAHELHDQVQEFFSSYRVLSEVHFSLNGRMGESNVR